MATISCNNCGKQIPDQAEFCPNCGCRVNHPIRPVTGQISYGMPAAPTPKYAPTYMQPFNPAGVPNTFQNVIPTYTKGTFAGGVIVANIIKIFGLFLPIIQVDDNFMNWLWYDTNGNQGIIDVGIYLLVASILSIFLVCIKKSIPLIIIEVVNFSILLSPIENHIYIAIISYYSQGRIFGVGLYFILIAELVSLICSIIYANRLEKLKHHSPQVSPQQFR